MNKETEISALEEEKLKYVQTLAAHYREFEGMNDNPQRDVIVKEILRCKEKIFSINERLVELKGDEFGPFAE